VRLVAGTEKSKGDICTSNSYHVESSEDKYKYKAELMLGCAEGHSRNISTKSDQWIQYVNSLQEKRDFWTVLNRPEIGKKPSGKRSRRFKTVQDIGSVKVFADGSGKTVRKILRTVRVKPSRIIIIILK
jgi:hypothetical protein